MYSKLVFSVIFSFVIIYSFPFLLPSSGSTLFIPLLLFIVIVAFTFWFVHPFGSKLVFNIIPVALSPICTTYFSSILYSYPLYVPSIVAFPSGEVIYISSVFSSSFTFSTRFFLIVSIFNVVLFVAASVCISNTHILNSSSYWATSVLFLALFYSQIFQIPVSLLH